MEIFNSIDNGYCFGFKATYRIGDTVKTIDHAESEVANNPALSIRTSTNVPLDGDNVISSMLVTPDNRDSRWNAFTITTKQGDTYNCG